MPKLPPPMRVYVYKALDPDDTTDPDGAFDEVFSDDPALSKAVTWLNQIEPKPAYAIVIKFKKWEYITP